MEQQTYPLADRAALIDALAASGLKQIQVASFVSPRAVPQMADTSELFAAIAKRPGTRYTALWLNDNGFERARACEQVDMRFAKPLDEALVLEMARTHDGIVTVEEGCIAGGAGSAVGECLAQAGLAVPLLHLGLPDVFIEHGDPVKLPAGLGLDAVGIEQSIRQRFLPRPTLAAVNG